MKLRLANLVIVGCLIIGGPALIAQPLETETARMLPAGRGKVAANLEYQTAAEGREIAIPLELEYGLTDDVQILVEPVAYTSIKPNTGRIASGLGDLEATLSYRFVRESLDIPALAVAGEIKIPIAKDTLIGTGKTDYAAYLIASKRFGPVDMHANIGYSILGNPPGVQLSDVINGSLAAEYHVSPVIDIVGEVFASTASVPETGENGTTSESLAAPEAAGGEAFITIGGRYFFRPNFYFALGISYDNNNAVLFRPGLALEF
ncbi:MAG: transporter [Candidatus Kapaibacterium sp.]